MIKVPGTPEPEVRRDHGDALISMLILSDVFLCVLDQI